MESEGPTYTKFLPWEWPYKFLSKLGHIDLYRDPADKD